MVFRRALRRSKRFQFDLSPRPFSTHRALKLRETIDIEAARDEVWPFLASPSHWPRWNPRILRIDRPRSGRTASELPGAWVPPPMGSLSGLGFHGWFKLSGLIVGGFLRLSSGPMLKSMRDADRPLAWVNSRWHGATLEKPARTAHNRNAPPHIKNASRWRGHPRLHPHRSGWLQVVS